MIRASSSFARTLAPLLLSALLALSPSLASAAAPPATSEDERATQARSRAIDFGVGAVLTGSALGLAAFGATELARAQTHLADCQALAMLGGETSAACRLDPPPLAFVSVGLSWALAIPLLVGGSLSFARGTARQRTRRASRAAYPTLEFHPRIELGSRARIAGAGAQLQLNF